MSYLAKARALGEAIAQTPEVQAIKAAEAEIMADPVSRAAFLQYQEKERQLVSAQMLSQIVPEKEALAHLETKIKLANKYPLIREFFAQQQSFDKIMAMVQLALTTTIHGLPNADQLPLPDGLKKMAQQLLDTISGGKQMPPLEVPADLKGIDLKGFLP
ncbi:MAG: YlbF family regulator [Peptococcaceae bacterium]|jgi:cell fate (sporulation/competence/biofilm development) regulator YlbF (YheA/YmcA/DUF963 family)|nr:YlbF family regulator [Peptococcaceae bacterium]